jgi:hypothetical protein
MGRFLMTGFALVVLLVLAGPTSSQTNAGRSVSVTLTSNEVVQGKFGGSTDLAFTVVVAGQKVSVPWTQIKAVAFAGAGSAGLETVPSPPSVSTLVSPSASTAPGNTQPASFGRCQATTKKGTQCSRNAKAGSNYCWQHGG